MQRNLLLKKLGGAKRNFAASVGAQTFVGPRHPSGSTPGVKKCVAGPDEMEFPSLLSL